MDYRKKRQFWYKKTYKKEPPPTTKDPLEAYQWCEKKKQSVQFREIYNSLITLGQFREKQKGCCNGTRGTGELLYIGQHILNESKRDENIAVTWIDYKKADDMVPQN